MAGPSSSSFDEFNTQIQSSALKATRNSMLLPSDVTFHRSMDAEFSNDLDEVSMRILGVANRLLGLVGGSDSNGKGKAKAKLENEEDVVDTFHSLVVDTMDQLLEKTDMNLDEFLGRNKAPAIAINPTIRSNKKSNNASGGQLDPVVQHASYLPKPQTSFKKKIDNSDSPWYPTLTHKYHAQVPLGYHFHDEEENEDVDGNSEKLVKLHPYRYELTHINYPSHLFSQSSPIPPTPFSTTSAKWISKPSELHDMISTLVHSNSKPTEIAVDLEHHSYRSYRGFLCLMQISTREQDWVVDLCVPEVREECESLNEVFADPNIVKVFHGAESDIVWLQQDFNIYVVNLFDTFHASKVLGFPRHGLANLLEMYCDFTPDKRYQLADWRIRPLPEPMLTYARSDTHFLLYIYDNLRNALLDRSRSASPANTPAPDVSSPSWKSAQIETKTKNVVEGNGSQGEGNLMDEVLKRSAETSLRVYEKELYDVEGGSGSGGWDTLARKWNRAHLMADWVPPSVHTAASSLPREVFKMVHVWRDKVAREEDESTRYVLPNHHLFTLAESPPTDITALLRVFPGTNVPPVIRRRAAELVADVRGAVKKCLEGEVSGESQGMEKGKEDRDKDEERVDVEKTVGEGKVEGKAMDVDITTPAANRRSMWGVSSIHSSSVTSKSSLFGSTLPFASTSSQQSQPTLSSSSTGKNIATYTSALFGNVGRGNDMISKVQKPETSAPRRFEEVVARIHSTLIIGASLPVSVAGPEAKISDKTTTTTTTAISTKTLTTTAEDIPEEEVGTLSSNVQIELPFVPASQRASSSKSAIATKDDTIVVVGQARQKREKKRKRDRAKGDEELEAEASGIASQGDGDANAMDAGHERDQPKAKRSRRSGKKGTNDSEPQSPSVENSDDHEIEAFDFSSAPNILDTVPPATNEASTSGKKKKDKKKDKEKKGSSTFYGDFPAPPKAHSELKSGNIAHTFK